MTAGLTITQAQAERWLLDDLAAAEAAVVRLLKPPAGLTQRQREALTSFCFNIGAGALAGSTLRRRINGGEPVSRVLPEELPRWVKGAAGPIAGLVIRRRAELAFSKECSPTVRYGDGGAIQLRVPYFSQRDSLTGQGLRMCFSSTLSLIHI